MNRSHRPPSCDRGASNQTSPLTSRDAVQYFVHDVCSAVDDQAARASIHSHTHQQGDDQRCTDRLQAHLESAESAIRGAAQWHRDASMIGFARSAIALAQVELAIAAEELASLAGDAL